MAVLGVCCAARAQVSCEESASPQGTSSAGLPQLAQGITLYEERDLVQAERALQAALFSGLAAPAERASAHKYLAYIYCTQNEWARCEAAFDAAFKAYPSFTLQAYEITGTPWKDAYGRARERRGQQLCPPPRDASLSRPAPASPESSAGSFALNSRVIASVTALTTGASSALPRPAALSGRTEAPPPDHNLRLRVSPWANVLIDGKPSGVTPPVIFLKLAPGTHNVELRNPGFDSYRQVVHLANGQLVTLSHDFDAR